MVKDYSKLGKIGSAARWKKVHSLLRISKKISKEKAAINAYLCGDGNICIQENKHMYAIRFYLDDLTLANRVVYLFKKEFNISPRIKKMESKVSNGRGYFLVVICCKPICDHLLKIGSYGHLKWSVPIWVKGNLELEWIKCFFDCEAYVNVKKRQIQLKSVNTTGLVAVKKMFEKYEIFPKLYGPYAQKGKNHHAYSFLIILGKENIRRYSKIVGFYHTRKIESLAKLCQLVNL